MKRLLILPIALLSAALAGGANGQSVVNVNADIAVSTTWTANNGYNLQQQIFVLPGATLTINAGTVVASTTGVGGSLAVCKGAQIFVKGTRDKPVIMTSTADTATWTGGNPRTGVWREAQNEWGNLTIMGAGYISENGVVGNVATRRSSTAAATTTKTAATSRICRFVTAARSSGSITSSTASRSAASVATRPFTTSRS
jgi:hypothetical protein